MTVSAESARLMPFAAGDILVGATDLNVPDDDHAGDGRIFQLDRDLNLKAIMMTRGTTHLVQGLAFGADGLLWAFDTAEHLIVWIDPKTGAQVSPPDRQFPARPWSGALWDKAGNVYLHEHLSGTMDQVPEKYRKMTKVVPGTDRVGDGNVYKFAPDGRLLDLYVTETSTSFAGYLGVTSCVLDPDERILTYTTETSKRIMRFDVREKRQLDDLLQLPDEAREYVFCVGACADGTILATRGPKWEHLAPDGRVIASHPLEGRGWATIKEALDGRHVFVTNFFDGTILKVDKATGSAVARASVPAQRALAGIAEYPG